MTKAEKTLSGYILSFAKKLKIVEKFGGKCIICGEDRPWLLCLHHKDPETKKENPCKLRNNRFSDMLEESEKCDLLCYNCHGEYHYKNRNRDKRRQLNKILMLSVVSNEHRCSLCGYKKIETCLDLHHLNPMKKESNFCKIGNKKRYKTADDIEDNIKDELRECVILCANCHHNLHFDKERYLQNYNEIIKKKENYKELRPPLPIEKIANLYNSGYSISNIAKIYNTNKSTICTITRKLNLGLSQEERIKKSLEWKEQADILFSQGKKWCEVADILKVNKGCVHRHMIKKYGKIINKK